jgi:hypothetical protein
MKDCELELPVVRADKRYFSLNHRGESKDTWGLVSDVTVRDGGTIITLRSIIQVSCMLRKRLICCELKHNHGALFKWNTLTCSALLVSKEQ